MSEGYIHAESPLTWLRRSLLVGKEARDIIQGLTVGQRCNPLWCQLRRMRVTASNFGVVLSAIERNRYDILVEQMQSSKYFTFYIRWYIYYKVLLHVSSFNSFGGCHTYPTNWNTIICFSYPPSLKKRLLSAYNLNLGHFLWRDSSAIVCYIRSYSQVYRPVS